MANHDQDLEALGLDLTTGDSSEAWVPTPHGRTLAAVLHEHPELYRGMRVLELGAGTAIHTILLLRGGAEHLTATEYTDDLVDVIRLNVERHVENAPIDYVRADWTHVDGSFDVIVANPPFCKSGKTNRRFFIDDLILNAHKCLVPGGRVIFIQSSMADLAKTERRLHENGFSMRVVDQSKGPFRDYYYLDEEFMGMARAVENGFEVIDGKEHETLSVIEATLVR